MIVGGSLMKDGLLLVSMQMKKALPFFFGGCVGQGLLD